MTLNDAFEAISTRYEFESFSHPNTRAIASGFYSPKSGIKIGCNSPSVLGSGSPNF